MQKQLFVRSIPAFAIAFGAFGCAAVLTASPATAATAADIAQADTELAPLEAEFRTLLLTNGKAKYLEYYADVDPSAKAKIAKAYGILRTKGLGDPKTAAAVAALCESAFGMKNAKAIVEAWSATGQNPGLETYTVANKVRLVAKFAPEILEFYDLAALDEIDRLQMEALNGMIARNLEETARIKERTARNLEETARIKEETARIKEETARNLEEAAQSEARAAQLQREIERMDKVIRRLGALLDRN